MASFHLNETVCFDQNNLFWYKTICFGTKQHRFDQHQKQEECPMTCHLATVHHLQPFVPKKMLG